MLGQNQRGLAAGVALANSIYPGLPSVMAGQAFSGNIVTRAGFVAQISNMGAMPLRGRLALDVGSVEGNPLTPWRCR